MYILLVFLLFKHVFIQVICCFGFNIREIFDRVLGWLQKRFTVHPCQEWWVECLNIIRICLFLYPKKSINLNLQVLEYQVLHYPKKLLRQFIWTKYHCSKCKGSFLNFVSALNNPKKWNIPRFFSEFLQNSNQIDSWTKMTKQIEKFCFVGFSFLCFHIYYFTSTA